VLSVAAVVVLVVAFLSFLLLLLVLLRLVVVAPGPDALRLAPVTVKAVTVNTFSNQDATWHQPYT
jgi:hypothetical protein